MQNNIKRCAVAVVAAALVSCGGNGTRNVHTQVVRSVPKPVARIHHYEPMPEFSLPLEPAQRSVEDVLHSFGPYVEQELKPYFEKAEISYPPRELTLIAYKLERKMELWARDSGEFRLIREYDIRAASGMRGPKLRQGDRQVPEGVYHIVGLNPNSNYHLSLRLDYPNDFDLFHARLDGRSDPGSDIFIHGKAVSIGCLAMGDAAIEQLFVLAARVGKENIKVVITPQDPRVDPLNPPGPGLPSWTPDLYDMISAEVLAYSNSVKVSSNRRYSSTDRRER